MKCQHCGSKDIISIQGQNFCLNCGVEVIAPPVSAPKAPKSKKTAHFPAANAGYKPAAKPQVSQASSLDHPKSKKSGQKSSSVHPLRFAIKVASSLALLAGTLIWASLWFKLDNDLVLYLSASGLAVLL
ncbi:MAG TPA: hypothetical protein VF272_04180, partial [Candidatus Saccharimonadia bacterium]